METISCLFIFSLVPWCRCILLFFSPEAGQVLLWRCECNGEFAFRSLLWLSSPLPWAVWAVGSFLIFWLLSKSSHWRCYFCISHLLPLSLTHLEVLCRSFRSAVFTHSIQALEKLGLAEEHTKLVLSSSTNTWAIDSVIRNPGDDSKGSSVQLPPHHFHKFPQLTPPDSFPAFSKEL